MESLALNRHQFRTSLTNRIYRSFAGENLIQVAFFLCCKRFHPAESFNYDAAAPQPSSPIQWLSVEQC